MNWIISWKISSMNWKRKFNNSKKNFEVESRMEKLPDFIFNCLEQLGVKIDQDLKVLKEEIVIKSKE